MAASNNFSEYYKTISNTELLSILDNPDEYQSSAVEAAKVEFSNRQLSESAILEARLPLVAKQARKDKEREMVKAVETKIKAAGNTFIDTINPIQPGVPSTERTIRFVVIVFSAIFLYQFITGFRDNVVYIKDISSYTFESIMILFPQVLLAVAIITFWKRETSGWILMAVFLTFSAVGAMWLLYESITWKSPGFAGFDNLFPRPSPTIHIIQLLFLAGTIYVLCKPSIREVYSIDKIRMRASIGFTFIVTIVILFAIT